MAAICPACGTANRLAAKFCKHCITPLPSPQMHDQGSGEEKTVPYVKTVQVARESHNDANRANAIHALPNDTEIEGFRILRQIGEGGFGIVYLAWDLALERRVAIKEYMPSSLAVRGMDATVSMRSEQHRETFDIGLKSFVNEAKLLARFDHPALVKVFRYWEANGTAYMAMPYYEGPTLKTALAQLGALAPEALLREWLAPLLDALDAMHREHCYHRDISPDNILLTASGPLLLDFGAARHVINDRTQVLTTMLKPGFAPVEQYGGTMLQGAWTDLYALAGVVHYAITGRPPVASVVRVVRDPQQPLAMTHVGQYSERFLRAIDEALSVRPESRPQDVAAFRALLDGGLEDIGERIEDASVEAPTADATPSAILEPAASNRRTRNRSLALAATLLIAVAAAWTSLGRLVPLDAPVAASTPPPVSVPQIAEPAPVSKEPSVKAPDPVEAQEPRPSRAAPAVAAVQIPRVAPRKPAAAPRTAQTSFESIAGAPEKNEKNRTVPQEHETTASYTQSGRPPRCSDLVLKSSLEPLNPEEATFQKTRCK